MECVDSAMYPQAEGTNCEEYCADFFLNCSEIDATDEVFASEAECVEVCQELTEAELCCRAANAAEASTENPENKCPRAAGQDTCAL